MQARLDAPAENPFAEISEQLTRLYAQKDATIETVFARLAPLEAKLAEIGRARDPQAALDGFAARLEALQSRLDAPAENPFAEISEQLTRLYAQKDATIETVFARLAPLEAKLAELQARSPRPARRRSTASPARLEALQSRLDAPAENPFAEISEQLTRLYAQKDATIETVFARLAPLEAKLAEIEDWRRRWRRWPRPSSSGARRLRGRLETLQRTQGEVAAGLAALRAVLGDGNVAQPFAAIAEQLDAAPRPEGREPRRARGAARATRGEARRDGPRATPRRRPAPRRARSPTSWLRSRPRRRRPSSSPTASRCSRRACRG